MASPLTLLRRLAGTSSFGANVASNYAGRLWEALMGIAFVPLYIRFLGAEAYGIIGLVAVIQAFMLILDFGMTPTLTREAARYQSGEHSVLHLKDLIRSIELVVLGVGVVIVAIVALIAPLVASYWVKPGQLSPSTITLALTLGGALIAGRLFESIFRGTLYGLQRQAICNALAAFFATARGVGAIAAIAVFHTGLGGFFIWQITISIASAAAMRLAVHFALPGGERGGRFSKPALASVGKFAGGMVTISILALAATQVDKVVLSRILPLETFGLYVFAVNVAVAIELVSAPLMTAIYPRIIAAIGRGDEAALIVLFHRWARIVCAITAPIAAMLAWYAKDIILVWSNNAALADSAGPILGIVAIGSFIHGQCVLPYQVQLGHGWTSLAVWANIVALMVSATSALILVPRYGLIAAAGSWVAVASIYFAIMTLALFGRYLTSERWTFLLKDILMPSVTAFAVAPLLAGLVHGADGRLWRLLALGCASGVTALMTIAVSIALDRTGRAWLAGRLRRGLRKGVR